MAYTTQPGIRTIRRQQWEAKVRAAEAEKARRNAQAHQAVIDSVAKIDIVRTPECGE